MSFSASIPLFSIRFAVVIPVVDYTAHENFKGCRRAQTAAYSYLTLDVCIKAVPAAVELSEQISESGKDPCNESRGGAALIFVGVRDAYFKRFISLRDYSDHITVILGYISLDLIRCRHYHYLSALMVGMVSENLYPSGSYI